MYSEHVKPMLSHINVGTGMEISILELVQLVAKITGYSCKFSTDPNKSDRTMHKLRNV